MCIKEASLFPPDLILLTCCELGNKVIKLIETQLPLELHKFETVKVHLYVILLPKVNPTAVHSGLNPLRQNHFGTKGTKDTEDGL